MDAPVAAETTLARLAETGEQMWRHRPVHARQLSAPLEWRNARGDRMHADAGAWLIIDGPRSWTVAEAAFAATYTALEDGTWLRTASLIAVQADTHLRVATLEGDAEVVPGDWVCFDAAGCWPVTADAFAAGDYRSEPPT